MKKALRITGIILLCMLIGYGVGWGLGHILGGGGDGESIDKIKMAKAVLIAFAALVVGVFANTILHEAGHLVGGLLTGYKFLSFRIFNLTLQKEDDDWHWKKFSIMGTLGQCLMCPPHTQNVPYFWYNVGGVMVNLIICVISGTMLYAFDLTMVPFEICVMLLATGVWFLLTNAIPMTPGGVPNDGKNILILWRHPEQRKHFHNMLAVAAEQSLGKRACEMSEEWFESTPVTKDSTVMEMSARNLHYARLMDEMRFDEAREVAEELMSIGRALPQLFQMEVASDLLFLELATLNRREVVNELWNKKIGVGNMTLQNYIQTYRKYLPMKCAGLFAYELINNQSTEDAQKYYDEVESNLNTYTQPGEARTAIAIMDEVLTKQL
ncbi:MAG: hypothetical protein MJZ36_08660 [Bacteroidaceae bacterium]|nr:hypothetical protein [Bacteroidaceae bacterium]